jgi:hypothetical protein
MVNPRTGAQVAFADGRPPERPACTGIDEDTLREILSNMGAVYLARFDRTVRLSDPDRANQLCESGVDPATRTARST